MGESINKTAGIGAAKQECFSKCNHETLEGRHPHVDLQLGRVGRQQRRAAGATPSRTSSALCCLRCANPVQDPHAIAVDGPEEITVDKWLAPLFEQHNFFVINQLGIDCRPEISTSLPTDFVRNFCLFIQHSGMREPLLS